MERSRYINLGRKYIQGLAFLMVLGIQRVAEHYVDKLEMPEAQHKGGYCRCAEQMGRKL